MSVQRWLACFALLGLLLPLVPPTAVAAQRPLPPEDLTALIAPQDTSYQTLPFTQDWSDTSLITTANDWSGVPGLIGHRGDDLTTTTGTDPQTILSDGTGTPVNVMANQTNPAGNTSGGLAEFELANPVVAFQGSGTADAPFLLLRLNTTGYKDITVSYVLRDLDSNADNAVQPVALHYRVGNSGNFTNVPEAFVADASDGPNLTKETPVSVVLPAAADNQPMLEIRWMTANAVGSDEWIGIDNITVTGTPLSEPHFAISKSAPAKVQTGSSFTYTLVATNYLNQAATSVVISDTLPADVTIGAISDGGSATGQIVTWTIATLADGETVTRTVQVTAPVTPTSLVNSDYGIAAGNWPTRTTGLPVTTLVEAPLELLPIGEARARGAGWRGRLQGNVTVTPGTYSANTFVIQDATGGMYVYAGATPLPAMSLGDEVEISGTLKLFNGLLEVDPLEGVTVHGTGTVPAPLSTSTGALGTTQGWLVEATGTATWTSAPPAPGAANWSFTLNDGTGPVTVFVDKDTGIAMSGYTSPTVLTVRGFSGNYNGAQLMPRFQADIFADTTAPQVASVTPANGATDVPMTANVSATFNEGMQAPEAGAFTLEGPAGPVAGTVSYTPATWTMTFTPDSALASNTPYTATLSTGIKDLASNPLAAPYVWTFTTEYVDLTAPTVTAVFPANGATQVPLDSVIWATFSEPVTGVNETSFTVTGLAGPIAGTVSYDPAMRTATFTPTASLELDGYYTATLSTAIQDLAGNPLAAPYVWSFATRTSITPIGEARTAGAGWSGTLRGVVTVPPGVYRNNAFVIQDTTGGMYIYAGSTALPSIALGDVVQVTGTLKLYNGLLEIDPLTGVSKHGTAPVPAPLFVGTGNVDATQGWLIRVSGTATFATTPPTPGASDWSFTLNDGSGAVKIFVDKDTRIDMRAYKTGDVLTIIGFSGNYNGAQVMPRYQSDVMVYDATPPQVTSTVPPADATGVSPYDPISATFNEAIKADTLTSDSFVLVGPAGAINGSVSYAAGTYTASFTPAAYLDPYTRYTATLTTAIQDLAGNALSAPYTWSFTTGAADTTPPTVSGRSPGPDATAVPLSASVVITFSESMAASSFTADTLYLSGPYGKVPASLTFNATQTVVTLDPTASLLPLQRYTVTLKAAVTDRVGNPLGTDEVWSFTTAPEPPMHVYFGDIHNHTSYSDGSGTPQQALASAKAAGMDFMALTDHSYAIDDTEWQSLLDAVDAATIPGDFVALRGFEYTQGAEGHINVYNTVRHAVRTNVAGCTYCDYTPNLERGVTVEGFYHWVEITGTQALDGAGTVMQFNHPGWINFNDWQYHPEVGDVARLEEVGNGSGTSYVFSEDEYIRSLDYGWKLGATNNADTHSPNWGFNTDHRTGVVMPELTKEALLEALRARRTFATEDKNFAFWMKANGAWMGSEIPNTGQIAFEVYGNDPDGETVTRVQLITNKGVVAAEYTPNAATFTWQPVLTIAPGVQYFYAKALQADGDRIVSSPIWTQGTVNIAITDLQAQPSLPTIYNPTLYTARITNRGLTTESVTVTFRVNGQVIGAVPVTLGVCSYGPCPDATANIAWQPTTTGPITLTAELSGVPAGDYPGDNLRELHGEVTDEKVPLVLIDAGHNNIGAGPHDARLFVQDLTAHGYNVLFNLDAITPSDLNTETVKLLIVNAYGPDQLTQDEINAIGDFVAAGGSVWLNGMSDYDAKVPWAYNLADRQNALLAAIEARVGAQIPVRFNDDEVLDGNDNNGYPWGVLWHDFPAAASTGIGINVTKIQSWSDSSLMDRNRTALTQEDLGSNGFLVIRGDLDSGTGTYGKPNRTHNVDAELNPAQRGDAYIYPDTIPLAEAAAYDIPGQAGRLFFYGDSNDIFNVFAYTAGDGKQNELFNLEVTLWLLGTPLQKMTIAEARADAEQNNTPDRLNQLVWVEGTITAAYGEFFNVLYVQDETGGITVHAPAGDIYASTYQRGAKVRVVGTIDIYQGDTEIEFFEAEQVQVLQPPASAPQPRVLSTAHAAQEAYQGWLVRVTGTVIATGTESILVDDGSGPVRAFLDGYNGTFDDIQLYDVVEVTGLASEDGAGPRIRVRNHGAHPAIADDVRVLAQGVTLTVQKTGQGTVTVSPELPAYMPGQQVTLTAVPAAGWLFAGWSGAVSSTDNPLVLTLTANASITANFTLASTPVSGVAFTWTPEVPLAGQSVTFSATVEAGTPPFTYVWDFGDETPVVTTTTSSVVHTFPRFVETKVYRVTLTVSNAYSVKQVTHDVRVRPRQLFLPLVLRNTRP